MKSVYIINGFLESGKTEFISFTLSQPYFQTKGTTLLILCEEGENEYDSEVLKKSHTVVELVEDEEEMTSAKMIELEKKHKPERIIIEYNGMWNFKNFKMPWHWKLEQQITIIDASTFQNYYTNMRSLLAEMLRKSELIIFNRCDGLLDQLSSFKRNVKAVNPQAEIIFEDKNGEVSQLFEEDLPYDLKDEELKLDDYGYGIFYLDAMDNLDRYIGKTVTFVAMVLKPEGSDGTYFVPGRMAMTCCADDMAFLGYVCKYEHSDALENKDWVEVTATVHEEYWKDYNSEGPVLHALRVTPAKKPKDEILNFA